MFIACDYDGALLGVIMAATRAEADAYFTGTGKLPHKIECIDPADVELPSLVVLLTSYDVLPSTRDKPVRVMKRGM